MKEKIRDYLKSELDESSIRCEIIAEGIIDLLSTPQPAQAKTALYSDKWLKLILDEHSKEEIALLYQQTGLKKVEVSNKLSQFKTDADEYIKTHADIFKTDNDKRIGKWAFVDGANSKVSQFKKIVEDKKKSIEVAFSGCSGEQDTINYAQISILTELLKKL